MKRSIASVKDFAEFVIKHGANDTFSASRYLTHKVSMMSLFMQTTKGRDKICCLLQYLADLYEACIKFSNIPEVREAARDRFSRKVASRIRESMKNGRKIFKFLKFLDSIRALHKLSHKHKPLIYKLIMSTMHVCNFFYYIMDHVIWGVNIGVLNEIVSSQFKSTIKGYKDSFSLGKAMLKLTKASLDYKLINDKEQALAREIINLPEKCIVEDSLAHQSALSLISSRSKRRQKQLNFVVTILRIFMLLRRLKVFGIQNRFSKISYACSGLIVTSIHIGLQITAHPNLLQLDKVIKETHKMTRANSMNFTTDRLRKIKSDLENALVDDSENEND